jgi:hypothetical protein
MIQHKEAAAGRWLEFSILEQIANVGSEVIRFYKWRDKGNAEYARLAGERALELLTLTKSDPKNRGPRLKELCRLYEVLVDQFYGFGEYGGSEQGMINYFLAFNYAARLEHEKALRKSFDELAKDPEECDVEYAFEAQAEVVLRDDDWPE